ncbi:MAG: Holliday junction branch migration protein RuvA [Clostridia bacterium]|nr:Holliday junction branch migration protein RuvA [Clostridia bacterium]
MFSFIVGSVCEVNEGYAVLQAGGIGFEVLCSSATLSEVSRAGGSVKLYTYLKTSEDGMSLFGFFHKEEKAMFQKLIGISGVGPKMAIAILSGITPKDLALCIANKDVKRLTSVKGVGKKTAERILLELKELVTAELAEAAEALPAGGDVLEEALAGDAIMALMALGFTRAESVKMASRAIAQGAQGTEQVISFALRNV